MADDIGQWLNELGLGQYEAVLAENDIELETLPHLSDDDLKELGLSLGHRRKLQVAINLEAHERSPLRSQSSPEAGVDRVALPEAERRQLTVLFCDLVGSTAISTRLDPEDMREMLRTYQEACSSVIVGHDGYVAKFMGDGVFAYFGYPRAQESDAERAIDAGLELVSAVAALNLNLKVRIGVATGTVAVGDIVGAGSSEEIAIAGQAPNLAARLQEIAEANTVIISEATHALAGGMFQTTALGKRDLKGFGDPVGAWAVRHRRRADSRFDALQRNGLSRYVGRDSEQALLIERWRTALDGEGQAVLVSGEAGIGKSRILRRFEESIDEKDYLRLIYQGSPLHMNTAFHPFIAHLERAAKIERSAQASDNLDRLERLLASGASDVAETAPVFADLLALPTDGRYPNDRISPERRRELILTALVDQLTGLAADQRVLFVFEDLQWADASSLALLRRAMDSITDRSVLMLVTTRPYGTNRLPESGHLTQLALARLSRRQSDELVRDVAGSVNLPEVVLQKIVARSDGIPLYIEELTKAVVEGGDMEIPSSLHDSLAARLDRLGPAKETAQLASVIGRTFDRALLLASSEHGAAETEAGLDALGAAELVYARTGDIFEFKHALVQDTAYQSLLRDRRRFLHKSVANALEYRFGERAAGDPALLAHHLIEGGEPDRAVEYLLRAGKMLNATSAHVEGHTALTQGLDLLLKRPAGPIRNRLELDFQASLSQTLVPLHGYSHADTERTVRRAQELLSETDDHSLQTSVLNNLSRLLYWRGKYSEAIEVGNQIISLAKSTQSRETFSVGHRVIAASAACMGRMDQYVDQAEAASGYIDQGTLKNSHWRFADNVAVAARCHFVTSQWIAGRGKGTESLAHDILETARETGHAATYAYALLFLRTLGGLVRKDYPAIADSAAEMLEFAKTADLPFWESLANAFVAAKEIARHEPEAAIDQLTMAFAKLDSLRSVTFRPSLHLMLSEARFLAGDISGAMHEIEQATGIAAKTQERWFMVDILCHKSRIHAECDGSTSKAARRAAWDAVDLAEEQGAKMFALRAAAQCSAVAAESAERRKALVVLKTVYDQVQNTAFPEDLAPYTALLKEAG